MALDWLDFYVYLQNKNINLIWLLFSCVCVCVPRLSSETSERGTLKMAHKCSKMENRVRVKNFYDIFSCDFIELYLYNASAHQSQLLEIFLAIPFVKKNSNLFFRNSNHNVYIYSNGQWTNVYTVTRTACITWRGRFELPHFKVGTPPLHSQWLSIKTYADTFRFSILLGHDKQYYNPRLYAITAYKSEKKMDRRKRRRKKLEFSIFIIIEILQQDTHLIVHSLYKS